MTRRKISKWLILFVVAIITIMFVLALRFTNILAELTFIFLISIIPIILLNLYFLLEKDINRRFKIVLPVFSSVFIIGYCYVFLFLLPSRFVVIKKFSDGEFGILLYNNIDEISKDRINLKKIKKRLEEIDPVTSKMNKSIRIETLNEVKHYESEMEFNEFIKKEISSLNASVTIVLQKIVEDSVHSRIYSASKNKDSMLSKTVVNIISSPFKLAEILKQNIESLLAISKTGTLDMNKPTTAVEKVIIASRHYEQSTKILEKVIDIPKDSQERQEKVKQAQAELMKSIQLDSLNDKSLAMLAYLKNTEESNHNSAAIYYQKAKQVQPQSYAYTWNLAQSYYLAGETAKAIRTLEDYLEQYGNLIDDASQRLEMEKLLRSYQGGK